MDRTSYSVQTAHDIVVERVDITAERFEGSIDVTSVVGQIDIYEHLDKPFLTGDLLLVDYDIVLKEANFQGTERIEIALKIPDGTTVTKTFLVEKIEMSVKNNDNNETLLLSLIEESGFRNYLENVNQFYFGKSDEIIASIVRDYTGRNINVLSQISDLPPFACIIPNWHPYEATTWLVNRTVKSYGAPYFLFSCLTEKDLVLDDLERMLREPPKNENFPYIYSQATTKEASGILIPDLHSYTIQNYTTEDIDDNLSLIRTGLASGKYSSVDMNAEIISAQTYAFSADRLFAEFNGKGIYSPKWLPIDLEFTMNGKKQTEYFSRVITEIIARDTYGEGVAGYADAGVQGSSLQLVVKSAAFRGWLGKNNIRLSIPGRNFLPGPKGYTKIGDRIDIKIQNNLQVQAGQTLSEDELLDQKRSGNYIIYAIKHSITSRRYEVSLDCFKLYNLNNKA